MEKVLFNQHWKPNTSFKFIAEDLWFQTFMCHIIWVTFVCCPICHILHWLTSMTEASSSDRITTFSHCIRLQWFTAPSDQIRNSAKPKRHNLTPAQRTLPYTWSNSEWKIILYNLTNYENGKRYNWRYSFRFYPEVVTFIIKYKKEIVLFVQRTFVFIFFLSFRWLLLSVSFLQTTAGGTNDSEQRKE